MSSFPQNAKILIANRGEVAVRIIHACHELGIPTVLVASELDRNGYAARTADEVCILPGDTLKDTYLNAELIVEQAKEYGCDAIHPGFGFLSEDAQFAQLILQAGIRWIGPHPDSMNQVSDKIAAKKLVDRLKIPTSPWMLIEANQVDTQAIADQIGFPCMIKAARGGGGKGLKIAQSEADLVGLIESAGREALNAFGDDRIFVERVLEDCRHIEIQMFGDCQGKVYTFGERDCTCQRRFQKIIEESPSPGLEDSERQTLEGYAQKMGKEIEYQNAGTVEFLWDATQRKAFFLEVNTRLQVEHGVTEERYGIDLVHMQILTGYGLSIESLLPTEPPRGHTLQLRLYAEDPWMRFLPQPGKIHQCQFPVRKGLRIETGIEEGDEISSSYDPMIAKWIVSDRDRIRCIQKSLQVLGDFQYQGPNANRDFLMACLESKPFQEGTMTTRWLDQDSLMEESYWSNDDFWKGLCRYFLGSTRAGTKTSTDGDAQNPTWGSGVAFSQIQWGRRGT